MTPVDPRAAAIKELASRELARRSLLNFTQRFVHRYMAGWVHEDIARHLEWFLAEVVAGRSPHLMLLMPPRTGKSQLSSVTFPAWALGHHPDLEFIGCAYNVGLAGDFSKKVKSIIDTPDYAALFPETRPDPNNWSVEGWGIHDKRGAYVAAGVGGGVTGKGANCLLIDDPCLAEGEKVLTHRGLVPVELVVVGDYVATHKARWRKVTAVYNNGVKEVIEVKAGNTKVRVTPEHLLYTTSGWVEAQKAENVYGCDLSGLRRRLPQKTARPQVLLTRVRGCVAESAAKIMRALRGYVSTAQRHGAKILLRLVHSRCTTGTQDTNMRGVRRAVQIAPAGAEILRTSVPQSVLAGRAEKEESRNNRTECGETGESTPAEQGHGQQTVRRVQEGVQACYTYAAVLQRGLQKLRALGAHARHWKLKLQARVSGWRAQQKVQTGHIASDACRSMLRGVRFACALGDAPHRREQTERRRVESGGVVQLVPHAVSQISRLGQAVVYDLTVEEDHSFIAEGLVVHNCKNAEEASSKDYLAKLWEWYGSTAYTRLSPGGGVLLTQTPWADLDLAGRIQQEMVDARRNDDPDVPQFKVVKYKAIAEDYEYRHVLTREITSYPEPLNAGDAENSGLELLREPGDALHPERYNEQQLARIRRTLSRRFWSALYQQEPVPDEGIIFSADQMIQAPLPDGKARVIIAWDFAISTGDDNDYTVGAVGLLDENDVLNIVDLVRFKSGDAFYIVDTMLNLGQKWYNLHNNLTIYVEDGHIWRGISAVFTKRCRERKFYALVNKLKPLTDKISRAAPLQARMQQGMVRFVKGASWYDVAVGELLRFPAGTHDDIVDALAWLAHAALVSAAPQPDKPARQPSWRDRLSKYVAGSSSGGGAMSA